MNRRVRSSDVLDVNAVTKQSIRAEIIGRFRPVGPNRWDDWELTTEDGGEEVAIPAGNTIQIEPLGAEPEIRFRFRKGRQVLRLRWLPEPDDLDALASGKWGVQEAEDASLIERIFHMGPENDPRDDMLEYFLDVLSDPHEQARGRGALAVLVEKLRNRG